MFDSRARPGAPLVLVLVLLLATSAVACTGSTPATSTSTTRDPLTAAATAAPPGAQPPAGTVAHGRKVRATTIARLPVTATSLVAATDGSELLVGDRSGVVRRLRLEDRDGLVVPELDEAPVLDLSTVVTLQFDRGFLNMALVDEGNSLVALYTGEDGDLILAEYDYTPGRPIDTSTERTLFRLPRPYPLHHGGGLAVDTDGDLLVGLGDMGILLPLVPGQQDPNLLLGGVLPVPARVLADRGATWHPRPADMIARGLRNPWRLAVDPADGSVYVGDVGDHLAEEIDRIDPDQPDPNFGYPYFEGTISMFPHTPEDVTYTPPLVERRRDTGVCGSVAGVVADGPSTPALDGRFLYADLCDTEVHALAVDAAGRVAHDDVVTDLPETAIGLANGADGQVYVLGSMGAIMRLDPASWTVADGAQAVEGLPTETTTTLPEDGDDCQVASVMGPLDFMGGLEPAALEQQLHDVLTKLAGIMPGLPAKVLPMAEQVQRTFQQVAAEFEAVGWNTSDPALAGLRQDILTGTGAFEGFPQALADLYDLGCA